MGADQFATLGNLAFYQGPSYKYVYFNSLLSNSGNATYVAEANRIANEGKSLYSSLDGSNNILESRMDNYSAKWEQLLAFLQTAIGYEQGNEIKYFTQQLAKFESTFSQEDIKNIPMLQRLKQTLEDAKSGSLEYMSFLALINTIMSGFDNAKTIAKYEKERITEIEAALNELRERRRSQVAGLAHAKRLNSEETQIMIDNSLETFDNEMVQYYVKHKNFRDTYNSEGKKVDYLRGAEAALKKIKGTVDVELAKWINKEVETIFKSKRLMNHIVNICREQGIVSGQKYTTLGTKVLSYIVVQIQAHARQHMNEILNDQYDSIDKDKILDALVKASESTQTYQIQGFFRNNYGVFKNNIKAYDEANRELDMQERSSEGMFAAFERLRNAIDKEKSHTISLKRDQRALWNYMKKEGIYTEFSSFSKLISNLTRFQEWIENSEKKLAKNPALAEQIAATARKKSFGKNTAGESVTLEVKINKEGHIEIVNLEQLKSLKVFQDIFGEDTNITLSTLKNSIRNLRYQGGRALRNRYAQAIDKATSQLKGSAREKERKKIDDIIYKGLSNIHVSVSGPTVSEILAAIDFDEKGQLVTNASGKAMAKNDVITITIDTDTMSIEADLKTLAQQRELTYANMIANNMTSNEIDTQFSADLVMAFQDATAKAFQKLGNKQHRYREAAKQFVNRYQNVQNKLKQLDKEEKALLKEWQAYKKQLEADGATPEEIKQKYNAFLNSLKDSIYVSTTVKTYSHYKNNVGFGGGSLGGNLNEQLANIFDMFELAGLPISAKDQEWLFGAIINSSPCTILGEAAKHSIENYLGSMAAFMLFDEGGAEVQILADIQNDSQQELASSNPAILHLYRVNGIYICGSYVLQEVYNQLQLCWQQASMALVPGYKGASVRIVNNISEADIPNRGKGKMNKTINPNPWGAVGKTAAAKVSIEIFFLAGLLDIATGIETALNNLQMPG